MPNKEVKKVHLKDKEGLTPTLVLTIITLITALLLAIVYQITKDKISDNKLGEARVVMEEFMPDADNFKEASSDVEGVNSIYEAVKGSEVIGYVVMSEATGYGGPVPVLTAINKDNTLAGVSIKGSSESPGFGKLAEESAFLDQFKGLPADKEFTFGGEAGKTNFDQVSGATVTSDAVKNALNIAVQAVQGLSK